MNTADSERLASYYEARGFEHAKNEKESDVVIINTCMVREKAEHKIYSIVNNLSQLNPKPKIIVTGCFVGAMEREPSGKMKKYAKRRMPNVDEFLLIDEVGFSNFPKRQNSKMALLPISSGCNNMCAYCIVPFARGREVSRPFEEILDEAKNLADSGYEEVVLLGQNVNSYGADLIQPSVILNPEFYRGEESNTIKLQTDSSSSQTPPRNDNKESLKNFKLPNGAQVKPVMVKSMGRTRIPTLFPYLLEEIANIPFKMVDFISSNPWDFSDELIEVMAKYKNINREIHLPVQSGDDEVLKKMNRWYTREEYLSLIKKITDKIPEAKFTTDIIVGFPGETEEQFDNTVDLCKQVDFNIAYISTYSPRPGTMAEKMIDDVTRAKKKRRFQALNRLVNRKIK
jgi:tRNA-2-methylthio-N6-dimethylallyladenosine synthase